MPDPSDTLRPNPDATTTAILLDAVGTVIAPDPGVLETYLNHGRRAGSNLGAGLIRKRFSGLRRKLFAPTDGDGLRSSDEMEHDLWRQLVVEIFDDVANPNQLFEDLWNHFAIPDHWSVFEDVAPLLNRIQTLRDSGNKVIIGLASNFDSRLLPVVSAKAELSPIGNIFCSAQIGFRKPAPAFFDCVLKELRSQHGDVSPIMTGDDRINDYEAPSAAGWKAYWLNRNTESNEKRPGEIRTLDELF